MRPTRLPRLRGMWGVMGSDGEGEEWEWGPEEDDDEAFFAATAGCWGD